MDFDSDPDTAELASGLRDLLESRLEGRALRATIADAPRRPSSC